MAQATAVDGHLAASSAPGFLAIKSAGTAYYQLVCGAAFPVRSQRRAWVSTGVSTAGAGSMREEHCFGTASGSWEAPIVEEPGVSGLHAQTPTLKTS